MLALTIIIERIIRFAVMKIPITSLEQELVDAIKNGEAELVVAKLRGPEAILLRGLLRAGQDGVRDLARVATRLGSMELQKMERGFRTLSILGNTAPLLGLLGTIIGMIKAFMVIEQAGGRVDAQALAGGIWEAMLTTGVGLAVAIPVLLALHVLEGMVDRRAQTMRSYASILLEQLQYIGSDEEQETVHHRDGVVHAV
jgi:biopolymer transport protein ExbB